eukprot:6135235-Amphidinium_carterae.2
MAKGYKENLCPLRPDIQYATNELTRGAVQETNQHAQRNAEHLLKYLHGTRNKKRWPLGPQPLNIPHRDSQGSGWT